MAWNYDRAKTRLADEWKRIDQTAYTITRLTREMDLNNLSATDVRQVNGVHTYVDITNVDELLYDASQCRDDYRRIYRTLHLTRKELRHIQQNLFNGDKIQVQGSKFHGLLYRPYNDPETMAARALLAGLAMNAALTTAFSTVFSTYPGLVPALGLELGDCLIASIGMRNDRELISIGNAANIPAKILTASQLSIGDTLYDALLPDLQEWFTHDGTAYRLNPATISTTELEDRISDEGFTWTLQGSIDRLQEEADSLPLTDIAVEGVRETIDIDSLGPKLAKTCSAATIFIDLDGFTKLIDDHSDDNDELIDAIKLLHLFRYELRAVTEHDYDGIAVQHQGDRLQVLYHDPDGTDDDVRATAVDIAIACNSSVEEVINIEHKDILGKIHVAIGCDMGKALIGKLGTKGDRDPVVISRAAITAEELQRDVAGNHLAITTTVYKALTDDAVKDQFTLRDDRNYEATGITFTKIDDAESTKAYKTATAAAYTSAGTITTAVRAPAAVAALRVTRPYAP